MKGIVLSAGRGSRLGAVTADRPKSLLNIEGRTLLERQVAALRFAGADEVGVVVGWKAQAFPRDEVVTFHNRDWATTSMVESLACATSWLTREDCLICYGDIVFSAADAHRIGRVRADLAIAYDPEWLDMWRSRFTDPCDDAETFRCDQAGMLLEIGGQPTDVNEVGGQYLGLLRCTPTGWEEMNRVRNGERTGHPRDMTDLLNRVVQARRVPIWTVPVHDPWWEFDTPTDLVVGAARVRALDLADRREQ
ncbi:phosphocholine cytidylyltransferase family protein [Nocardia gipuzkoensis]